MDKQKFQLRIRWQLSYHSQNKTVCSVRSYIATETYRSRRASHKRLSKQKDKAHVTFTFVNKTRAGNRCSDSYQALRVVIPGGAPELLPWVAARPRPQPWGRLLRPRAPCPAPGWADTSTPETWHSGGGNSPLRQLNHQQQKRQRRDGDLGPFPPAPAPPARRPLTVLGEDIEASLGAAPGRLSPAARGPGRAAPPQSPRLLVLRRRLVLEPGARLPDAAHLLPHRRAPGRGPRSHAAADAASPARQAASPLLPSARPGGSRPPRRPRRPRGAPAWDSRTRPLSPRRHLKPQSARRAGTERLPQPPPVRRGRPLSPPPPQPVARRVTRGDTGSAVWPRPSEVLIFHSPCWLLLQQRLGSVAA